MAESPAETSKRVCAITGAHGFLGTHIARALSASGWEIVRLGRHDGDVPFALGNDLDPAELSSRGVTALVHAAYDFGAREWDEIERTNVEGSRRLLAAAKSAKVRKIVLISSTAAFDGCVAMYGRAKLATENVFRDPSAAILRPGLIYSEVPRGLVGTIAGIVNKVPVVPLISASQVMHTCHVEDVARFVERLLSLDAPMPQGPIPVVADEALTFKEVIGKLAKKAGRSPFVVPVPSTPVWAALKAVELLGLKIGLRSDSVRSLASANSSIDVERAKSFGVPLRKFLEASA